MRTIGGLAAILDGHGDDVAEVLWLAALAALERASGLARQEDGLYFRFRTHPDGELRRLRADVALAMRLARLAAAAQREHNDIEYELMQPARDAARAARLERLRRNNPSVRRGRENGQQRPQEPL